MTSGFPDRFGFSGKTAIFQVISAELTGGSELTIFDPFHRLIRIDLPKIWLLIPARFLAQIPEITPGSLDQFGLLRKILFFPKIWAVSEVKIFGQKSIMTRKREELRFFSAHDASFLGFIGVS